jgi:hypothetical protein
MSAQQIIDRLDFVRATGKDGYIARCPAHDDRSPSLSIKETSDGRVLIHCHAGCGALDVLTAIGLEWDAIYPPTDREYRVGRRKPRGESVDSLVVEIAEHDRAMGKRLSKRDVEAYRAALKRNPPKSDVITEIAFELGIVR